ncbi:DUF2171 domain-containing protein [Methylobacterium sp. A54F]
MPRISLALATLVGLAVPALAQTTPEAGAARIRERMAVVGLDGGPVGTVDEVVNGTITLTRDGPAAGGKRHTIPAAWVGAVDRQVQLTRTTAEAKAGWSEAAPPGEAARR